MDDLDRRLVAFAGAHRFVRLEQAARFAGVGRVEVKARYGTLASDGAVRRELVGPGGELVFRATRSGLASIGSRLEVAPFGLDGFRHEVGVVWFWVLAWEGQLGEPERVLSRREMEGLDRAGLAHGEAASGFSVRLPASAGSTAPLYPDVMLVYEGGSRVAVHLVTWPYRYWDLGALFAAYREQPDRPGLIGVFVDDRRVGEWVAAIGERQGIGDRLRIRAVAGEATAAPQLSR